jgi:hypothetical protein
MWRDNAVKEVAAIVECFQKVSCKLLKQMQSIAVQGEGIMYYDLDPEKKDTFGDRTMYMKDIVMSCSLGSGVAPIMGETTGYNLLNAGDDRNTTGKDMMVNMVKFDFDLLDGYEGPLFAQVVGPWPASKAVQVAEVVTEEKRIAHEEAETHRKFLEKLKIAFAQIDSNHDGYVTQDEVEKALDGPERVKEIREKMSDAQGKMEGVFSTFLSAGAGMFMDVPSEADVKKLQALLALEGDAKLSLDELRSMN